MNHQTSFQIEKKSTSTAGHTLAESTLVRLANTFNVSVNQLMKNSQHYFGKALHSQFLEAAF